MARSGADLAVCINAGDPVTTPDTRILCKGG